jgi:tRNA (mo5U34)-methyltransferase
VAGCIWVAGRAPGGGCIDALRTVELAAVAPVRFCNNVSGSRASVVACQRSGMQPNGAHGLHPARARMSTLPTSDPLSRETIDALGPWFQNFRLDGLETAPAHPLGDYPSAYYRRFAQAFPRDLTGWSVLEVGCNAGFYAFEMKRRGASRVVAIDSEPLYLRQARLVAERTGLDVEFQLRSIYDVGDLGERFDLVLFMGVLYHLRHPLLALDLLRRYAVGRLLIFQSMLRGSSSRRVWDPDYPFSDRRPFDDPAWPRLHFVEHRYAGDASNWWIPNGAGAEAMLRSAGFTVTDHPDDEVFVCRPDDAAPPVPLPAALERRRD